VVPEVQVTFAVPAGTAPLPVGRRRKSQTSRPARRTQEVMRAQRDAYAHLNNGVLHRANQGVTINQVHNVYDVPKSLQQQWAARSYHGSVEHNSRAVINRYLGYWDGNPTTLIPLSPEDSAPLYVEMMGSAEPILAKGKALYDEGRYRHAQEILNKLVYAEPQNHAAKDLLADDADLTVTINREDLVSTMMGAVSFDEQITAGRATLEGNREIYEQLKAMLVHFDLGFEIMPGTGVKDLTPEQKPFEQEEPANTSGG